MHFQCPIRSWLQNLAFKMEIFAFVVNPVFFVIEKRHCVVLRPVTTSILSWMVGFLFVFRAQGEDGVGGGAGKDFGVDVQSGDDGGVVRLGREQQTRQAGNAADENPRRKVGVIAFRHGGVKRAGKP
jgi:hypothetical protein